MLTKRPADILSSSLRCPKCLFLQKYVTKDDEEKEAAAGDQPDGSWEKAETNMSTRNVN